MNADPQKIRIEDYTYHLPNEKIAEYPLDNRSDSKLLIYKNGSIVESVFNQLPSQIPSNAHIVFNNSKVVAARLPFKKDTGAQIEVFCLNPDERYQDVTTAFLQKKQVFWWCLVGGIAKWKNEAIIHIHHDHHILSAQLIKRTQNGCLISFEWNTDISFAEILHIVGNIPLPPYIKRAATLKDEEQYQTVYALQDGSVAAPTAGLHFTNEVLEALQQNNVLESYVTLHVGAGTFMPVKAEQIGDHNMHTEIIEVHKSLIEVLKKQNHKPLIATGTTSLRTLESLYWIGVKIATRQINENEIFLGQWDAYQLAKENISIQESLQHIIEYLEKNQLDTLYAKTQIIIAPGYAFKMVDAIITNFHQPNSTLLLLIAAFVGEDWRKIYDYALSHQFRFLSYGDSSLLWRTKQ
ncbi:MAG: S-adenosylmethionine:tRNA ribosyltransferase-isomerase [Chitinophagaceae bacterium]|nr:MAG: S-adenosylmethionine:tRNA ribosyltransferase-isomerase [Chitinophagaceae bacterium]